MSGVSPKHYQPSPQQIPISEFGTHFGYFRRTHIFCIPLPLCAFVVKHPYDYAFRKTLYRFWY
jgi:hypothetical protein